jgi:GntR family transcriptional regulator, transcriptional repressor for pyruvate dehydrogenase complex
MKNFKRDRQISLSDFDFRSASAAAHGSLRPTTMPRPDEPRSLEPVDSAARRLTADEADGGVRPAPRRVRRAYEQVYDQLREWIFTGTIANGGKLPSELVLASDFGVSRSTVRDALRMLSTEGLIRTAKGAGGGSFVTLPTVDHISEFVQRNIELLSLTDDVTLAEFLQARRLFEVWAVRDVALHRTEADMAALAATLVPEDSELSADDQYHHNKQFHVVLNELCGNPLLRIAAQPVFSVLHTHLGRSALAIEFPQRVCSEHTVILDAIRDRDADRAEQLMVDHLAWLGDVYRGIWRPGRGARQDHAATN